MIVLAPVLDDPGDLRVVATGTGDEAITWSLDGVQVAQTHDREAAAFHAGAGRHRLTAQSPSRTAWMAMARLVPRGDGFALAPSWSGHASGQPPVVIPSGSAAAALGLALLLARGWGRHSKGP